ncbi:unnamed protein product [Protopolystoma xenopodis]|uniref:Uncharacterized protein n=1 Tax=Protopolystoma xenopodis TaxID=117903 RepID=A0A3S5B6G1_9PLAT|nr:unnamed protein product [Protopolystoma xenopodis]
MRIPPNSPKAQMMQDLYRLPSRPGRRHWPKTMKAAVASYKSASHTSPNQMGQSLGSYVFDASVSTLPGGRSCTCAHYHFSATSHLYDLNPNETVVDTI